MTLDRAIDLMIGEELCIQRASGHYLNADGDMVETSLPPCKRGCGTCPLVADDKELLEAYHYVIALLQMQEGKK